jgi:opacity protein-like surface antigen
MKKFVLGSVALAAMLATPAMAADMPIKAPPPLPVCYDWSGFYLGGHAGYLFGDTSWAFRDEFEEFPRRTLGLELEQFFGGFHGGIQWQFGCSPWGNFVFGVEGAWSVTDDHRVRVNDPRFFTEGLVDARFAAWTLMDDFSTAGVRLGWAWDTWLFTVSGGWAGANIRTGLVVIDTDNPVLLPLGRSIAQDTHLHSGWYVGAAVEKMVAKGPFVDFIIGFEYQFISLDVEPHCEVVNAPAHCNLGLTAMQLPDADLQRDRKDVDAEIHTFRARLTIKTPGFGFLPVVGKAPVP